MAVASFEDHVAVAPSPTVMVQHGVGQSYFGDPKSARNPSYSGGRGRERVVLFLEPSEYAASATQKTSPDAAIAIVGSPRLDKWHGRSFTPSDPPVVTLSFHCDLHVVPETRWAQPHYNQAIIDLVRSNPPYEIWGHIHPRFRTWGMKFWGRLGVPFHEDFEDVLEHSSCYVIDNSSTAVEFAATGRPVVFLSAPWYRRGVDHGGRFWDWPKGQVHVEEPEDLADGIKMALTDPPEIRKARTAMIEKAYGGLIDGQATMRAVGALIDFTLN